MDMKRIASILLAVLTVSLATSLAGCQTDGTAGGSGSNSSSSGGY
jgi:predicted small secreted protein